MWQLVGGAEMKKGQTPHSHVAAEDQQKHLSCKGHLKEQEVSTPTPALSPECQSSEEEPI